MRPLTFTRPKVLVPAAGETLLDHVFRRLAVAGVDEALLVTMYLPEQVEAWAEGAELYGIDISITRQSRERYGTGAATLTAKQWVGDEPFLMTFGDVLAGETNFPTLVGMHRKNPDATIVTAYRQELVRGGVVLAEEGRLVALDEHPDQPVPNGLINAGMYLLQPHVFDRLSLVKPSQKGEYELTDVLGDMGRESDKPLVMEVEDYWVNVSGAPDVLAVQSLILGSGAGRLTATGCSSTRARRSRARGAESSHQDRGRDTHRSSDYRPQWRSVRALRGRRWCGPGGLRSA